MLVTIVPFAEWRPDVSNLNSAFAQDIRNVLCSAGQYIPCPDLVPFSDPLGTSPFGGFSARDNAGQVIIFAGTADKLWKFNQSTSGWDDISRTSGGGYNALESERWRFAQFGDYVIAVNANDAPQVFQLGVSATFANLGGNPPNAAYVGVWGDFLVLGGLPSNPGRVQWSGLNNITQWTPGTNNSDYQDFADGGAVRGFTNATNPIIFMRSAIWFGTFVPGSTIVFTFQKIHEQRGSAAPYAIASRGEATFFADAGGFFQITPDGAIDPIGFEKIDRTIFEKIQGSELYGIIGEVDPFFTRVYWAIKYNSTGSTFDRLIVYDWYLKQWTQIDGNIDILFPLASGTVGYTLEGLDAVSASLDALPFSLDSKVWQGGAPVMAAFDADNRLAFFSGKPMEARLTTQEMGDTAGSVSMVKSVQPVIDTNELFVSIGGRFRRGDQFVWTPEVPPSSNTGRMRKRYRARFHCFRIRVPAETQWTAAQGIDVEAMPMGRR